MENTKVVFNDNGYGEVQLFSNDIKAGEMVISINHAKLVVYHTEVRPEYEGQGFAKLLLDQLVGYARENGLKIIPLCPYVYAQFRRHATLYADIWSNVH